MGRPRAFPVPLMGAGPSPVMGAWLGVGLLAGIIRCRPILRVDVRASPLPGHFPPPPRHPRPNFPPISGVSGRPGP
ncbi:MAG: hypothetical protein DI570_15790 [Phenylobacterium zucineum]|nr:MAG: hypothetical protein DI570_15790 [Phenylobacterium zucineum]